MLMITWRVRYRKTMLKSVSQSRMRPESMEIGIRRILSNLGAE
ncbi:hypothetical protein AU15_16375 [Marinobacter salarius]|uniref:Uncharacterized protein n=1 Tax=Marinobacter salarius TaxID=1420917 RepID=W5YVM1_9GAMM|nr:hypothetical protein AU15_16375 [Marinobacter salarius]